LLLGFKKQNVLNMLFSELLVSIYLIKEKLFCQKSGRMWEKVGKVPIFEL